MKIDWKSSHSKRWWMMGRKMRNRNEEFIINFYFVTICPFLPSFWLTTHFWMGLSQFLMSKIQCWKLCALSALTKRYVRIVLACTSITFDCRAQIPEFQFIFFSEKYLAPFEVTKVEECMFKFSFEHTKTQAHIYLSTYLPAYLILWEGKCNRGQLYWNRRWVRFCRGVAPYG